MRPLLVALGAVMVLVGAVWTLQGLGYLEGSPMTDQEIWAILGPLLAGLGVGLVVVAARRRE
jgi:NO-binding membrane sensor protein with MHYT domain